ncbi:hypothetical protein [Limnoglobus roseus]|uniref:SMI1/KNR4 family protein n=1 Tax=Limnoglobus roseus TaxID=2598579 RepID=A0A5C1A3K7_9BACT|nr:hypothetical protein [Limnoglobus roseus]QEL13160.1 SMI1/KNR4 family protein [Limnoglobus roseus]
MTEEEWLRGQSPEPLIEKIEQLHLSRKISLLGLAFCARLASLVTDSRHRNVFLGAEDYFEGIITTEQFDRLLKPVIAMWAQEGFRTADSIENCLTAAARHALQDGNAIYLARFVAMAKGLEAGPEDSVECQRGISTEETALCELIRDIFGNPFRPVAIDSAWLTPTTVAIAEGIYAEKAFDRLPILADALQDAGCENADILTHLRSDGPHVKGCWALDLVLGKE